MSLLFFEAPKELKVCLLIIVVLAGVVRVEELMLREELALASGSGSDLKNVKVWIHLFVTWMREQIFFSLRSYQRGRHRRCASVLAGVLHSSDFNLPNFSASHPLQIGKLCHNVFLPTRIIEIASILLGKLFAKDAFCGTLGSLQATTATG